MKTNSASKSWGVFKSGQHLFAVNTIFLREVIPHQRMDPPPQTLQGLMGYIAVRGQSIPVLDLHAVMGHEPDVSSKNQIFVVTSLNGSEVAVLADEIYDVMTFRPENMTRFSEEEESFLIEGSVDESRLGRLAYVLSVSGLHKHCAEVASHRHEEKVVQISQQDRQDKQTLDALADLRRNPLIVVLVGKRQFAFRSSEVKTTTLISEMEKDQPASGYYLGMFKHYDAFLPLVDLGSLLGLEPAAQSSEYHALIVKTDEGELGLRIDGLLELSRNQLHRCFNVRAESHAYISKAYQFREDDCTVSLLVEIAELVAEPQLKELAKTAAKLTSQVYRETSVERANKHNARKVISFFVGMEAAVEMDMIEEIVNLEECALLSLDQHHSQTYICRNDELIPVYDLADLFDINPAYRQPAKYVFLIHVDEKMYALSVHSIGAIHTVYWSPETLSLSRANSASGGPAKQRLTEIERDGLTHLIRLLVRDDLDGFVRKHIQKNPPESGLSSEVLADAQRDDLTEALSE